MTAKKTRTKPSHEPIVCDYVRQGARITSRCDELELESPPMWNRGDAEMWMEREVVKALEIPWAALCFQHKETVEMGA